MAIKFDIVTDSGAYSGALHNGVNLQGLVEFSADSNSCESIQAGIMDIQDTYFPGYYPVECNFTVLESRGTIFMQDPNTLEYFATTVQTQVDPDIIVSYDSFLEIQVFEVIAIVVIFAIVNARSVINRD